MSNRRLSFSLQILTGIMLGAAWLLTRALRKHRDAGGTTAQSGRYHSLRYGRGSMLSLLLYAADVYAIPAVLRSKPEIDAAELAALQPAQLSFPGRLALGLIPQDRALYRIISDKVLAGIILLPLLLLADRRLRRDAGTLGMLYLWLHAVTYTLYSYSPLGPAFIDKYRPVVYYTEVPEEERARGNNRNACYSGHTGNAACASFFMAKVYHDYHPELSQAACARLYALAFAPPLLLGTLRIRALKHFPSDIMMAIVIGGVCGIAIPEQHKVRSSKK